MSACSTVTRASSPGPAAYRVVEGARILSVPRAVVGQLGRWQRVKLRAHVRDDKADDSGGLDEAGVVADVHVARTGVEVGAVADAASRKPSAYGGAGSAYM